MRPSPAKGGLRYNGEQSAGGGQTGAGQVTVKGFLAVLPRQPLFLLSAVGNRRRVQETVGGGKPYTSRSKKTTESPPINRFGEGKMVP